MERVDHTHVLPHGSFNGDPDDAASFLMSKPVRLGRGAMILYKLSVQVSES